MKLLFALPLVGLLAACAGGSTIVPPPPETLPVIPTADMSNDDICLAIMENEANLIAWKAYGQIWASMFNIDLDEKIDEYVGNNEALATLMETRNIACEAVL